MSFQTIVDIQQSMTVNNRRTVGQQVTRSGQIRTAQYLTAVPWVFTIVPHNYLYYPQVRDVIQTIDNLDRELPANITFSGTTLSWFTEYKGGLSAVQAAALTLASVPPANSQTITVGNLPAVGSSTDVYKRQRLCLQRVTSFNSAATSTRSRLKCCAAVARPYR